MVINLLCGVRGANRHVVRRRLLEGVERAGLAASDIRDWSRRLLPRFPAATAGRHWMEQQSIDHTPAGLTATSRLLAACPKIGYPPAPSVSRTVAARIRVIASLDPSI